MFPYTKHITYKARKIINTDVKSFYKVLSHNYSLCKMVVELRSGSKINHNNNETSATTEKKSTRDQIGADEHSKMTSVVFIGLLLDLLAFTLILPLFPSLLDHYKKNDGLCTKLTMEFCCKKRKKRKSGTYIFGLFLCNFTKFFTEYIFFF